MKKILLLIALPFIFLACNAAEENNEIEQKGANAVPKEEIVREGNAEIVKKNVSDEESVENIVESIKTLKKPDSFGDSASYSMGYFDGQQLGRSPSFALEVLYYIKGFITGYEQRKGMLTQTEVENVLRVFTEQQLKIETERQKRQQQEMAQQGFQSNPEMKAAADKNLKEANEFLAKNKNKKGIITTASGLQYEIIKKTDGGGNPDFMSEVMISVVGKLLDGKEILNTRQMDQPMTIPVNQLASGWGEVVQLMKVGSVYRAYLHPDLAFGPMGLKNSVPPNALVILEIELLEFRKPDIQGQ